MSSGPENDLDGDVARPMTALDLLSPLARALVIASAAAAVGLGTLLGTRAGWMPTLVLILWSDSGSEAHPVSTEVSIDGRRVIRRTLRGDQRLTEIVSVPGENKRFVLEVDVTSAPAVQPRPRLAVQWEFVK